jgi:hypothetical protein
LKNHFPGSIVTIAAIAASLLVVLPAVAQEEGAPRAGGGGGGGARRNTRPATPTPRLADGHPDLGNGAGSWSPLVVPNIAGSDPGAARQSKLVEKPVDVPFLPWAKKVYDERNAVLSKNDPESRCLPPGVPRMMATPFPFQIFQESDRIIFIFEGGAHVWRVIPMDGRKHPADPNPTFLGDSVGHWEGDTLVVDVVGFNDETWLDQVGHPHSDVLHVVERYTRTDSNTLHYEALIDDPKTYSKSWTTSWNIPFQPGWELNEYICQENNKDLAHMVGK